MGRKGRRKARKLRRRAKRRAERREQRAPEPDEGGRDLATRLLDRIRREAVARRFGGR